MTIPTKLTPAMKNLLKQMQVPGAHIRKWLYDPGYTFYFREESTVRRPVKWEWMIFLKPCFVEDYNSGSKTYRYTLRPDVKITNEWVQEQARLWEESAQQEKRAAEAEETAAEQYASDWFNAELSGPYRVKISGKWPFCGSVYYQDQYLFGIDPVSISSSDGSFAKMLSNHPETEKQFKAIRTMLRRANKVAVDHLEAQTEEANCDEEP